MKVTGAVFPFRVMKGDGFCCISASAQLAFDEAASADCKKAELPKKVMLFKHHAEAGPV